MILPVSGWLSPVGLQAAKTGALLLVDLAGILFPSSFPGFLPCACSRLRIVPSTERAALNKDLAAPWVAMLGKERKLNSKTGSVCLLLWTLQNQRALSRDLNLPGDNNSGTPSRLDVREARGTERRCCLSSAFVRLCVVSLPLCGGEAGNGGCRSGKG